MLTIKAAPQTGQREEKRGGENLGSFKLMEKLHHRLKHPQLPKALGVPGRNLAPIPSIWV